MVPRSDSTTSIVRPLIGGKAQRASREEAGATPPGGGGDPGGEAEHEPAHNQALLQALADLGVQNPKRSQLARLDIDPLWVQAWQRWAKHPHRQSLTNPVGNILLKLQSGERPPRAFLREAEQESRLTAWTEAQAQADEGEDPEAQEDSEPEDDDLAGARRLWARSLCEIEMQMTRSAFVTWLMGSRVVEAGDGCLTVAVRHAHAVAWLQQSYLPLIERTLARHAGGEVKITFVAGV